MAGIVTQLAQAAREHYEKGSRKSKEIAVGGVTLDLIPSSTSTGKAFMMGYTVDDDSGGMLGDIYPTSIRLALEEKIAKTKDIADKFDRWILILIDDVLPGIILVSVKPRTSGRGYKRLGSHVTGDSFAAQCTLSRC